MSEIESAGCWSRDAGHFQVIHNILANISVGNDDFTCTTDRRRLITAKVRLPAGLSFSVQLQIVQVDDSISTWLKLVTPVQRPHRHRSHLQC